MKLGENSANSLPERGTLSFNFRPSTRVQTWRQRFCGKTKATAFACSDDGNLFGVSTCWSVDGSTGRPLVRIDCPENVLRNKYSNNCILNKDGMVYIRGAFPGQCKAPVGIPSGYHIF